jgi:hypothetical protein
VLHYVTAGSSSLYENVIGIQSVLWLVGILFPYQKHKVKGNLFRLFSTTIGRIWHFVKGSDTRVMQYEPAKKFQKLQWRSPEAPRLKKVLISVTLKFWNHQTANLLKEAKSDWLAGKAAT